MESQSERNPESNPENAEAHIKSAHQILKALQAKIGQHPEIGSAITKRETALDDLAIQTGGCSGRAYLLEEKDREIADVEARWKDRILAACKSILEEQRKRMTSGSKVAGLGQRLLVKNLSTNSPRKVENAGWKIRW